MTATAGSGVAELVLANGLRVQAVRRASVPLVRVRLQVPARRRDPGAAAALELTAAAASGGPGRTARRLARAGAAVAGWTTPEHVSVDGHGTPAALPALLDRVAEIATEPPPGGPHLDRIRDELVAGLAAGARDPGRRAATHLDRVRFAAAPELAAPDPALVAEVPVDALGAALRPALRPHGSVLILAGDLDPGRALDAAARALDRWAAGPPATRLVLPPAVESRQEARLPGPEPALLRLTTATAAPDEPDGPAVQLAVAVLGGSFGSRLVRELRQVHGLAYSVQAGPDAVAATRSVAVDVRLLLRDADRAAGLVRDLVAALAGSPPTPAEIDAARSCALGRLAVAGSTQATVVDGLARLALLGLPHDWLQDHARRLAAVPVADVARAAAGLATARWTQVLVGGRPDDHEETT